MQERLLAEKLIGYDSSTPEGVRRPGAFRESAAPLRVDR